MQIKPFHSVALFICGSTMLAACANAADYTGKYEGTNLSVVIAPDGSAFAGEIHLGEQRFPLKAHEEANQLKGTFSSGGDDFPFIATLRGNDMTLVSGGQSYTLHRPAPPPVNPLAAAKPANPLQPGGDRATGAGDALADYTIVNHSDFGKALTRQFASATSVRAALQSTFPDLAKYFGARPNILGAYEDQRDHKSAGVSFSAKLNGQPVQGFVSSKLGDQGATVAVIYCRADAPKTEWTKLISKPEAGAGENANANDHAADVKAAAAQVPLKEYTFPDNTGTVGIAEGWTTNAQTIGGASLKGPADQQVILGIGAEVITPDGPMMQMQRQLAMNARQLGGQPPPPINMIVAPYSADPTTALKNLVPAISELSQRNSRPTSSIEKIIQDWKVPAVTPNANAGLILFDVTTTTDGVAKHYRSLIQLEVYPLGQGAWAFYATQLIAPQDTFKQDLPVMLAQSMSLKENAAVIQQKTRENIAAQNQRFEAMQAANRKVQEAYDSQNKAWARNQLIRDRSNTDFDEVIRGYRTVEDTQTGNRTSVDLGNVHDVVEGLNQYDPGRYKEIPLRDELYPLPGHENDR